MGDVAADVGAKHLRSARHVPSHDDHAGPGLTACEAPDTTTIPVVDPLPVTSRKSTRISKSTDTSKSCRKGWGQRGTSAQAGSATNEQRSRCRHLGACWRRGRQSDRSAPAIGAAGGVPGGGHPGRAGPGASLEADLPTRSAPGPALAIRRGIERRSVREPRESTLLCRLKLEHRDLRLTRAQLFKELVHLCRARCPSEAKSRRLNGRLVANCGRSVDRHRQQLIGEVEVVVAFGKGLLSNESVLPSSSAIAAVQSRSSSACSDEICAVGGASISAAARH